MDRANLRRNLPIIFGVIAAILWVTVKGPVALTFSMVGGILLGAFFALSKEPGAGTQP